MLKVRPTGSLWSVRNVHVDPTEYLGGGLGEIGPLKEKPRPITFVGSPRDRSGYSTFVEAG